MGATVSLHCPACAGRVTVRVEDDVPIPQLPDELDTCISIYSTVHEIDAHLDEIEVGA